MDTTLGAPVRYLYQLTDRDGEVITVDGRMLGSGSSEHPGKHRWFEVDIYRDDVRAVYVVHTRGKSNLANESTLTRVISTASAFEVVELLTVNHDGKIYLPRQSSRALAQAAQWDDDIRDAYVNRAVL